MNERKGIGILAALATCLTVATPVSAHNTWSQSGITREIQHTTGVSVVMIEDHKLGSNSSVFFKVEAFCGLGTKMEVSSFSGHSSIWQRDNRSTNRWWRMEEDGTRFYAPKPASIDHQFAFACHHWGRG